MTTIGLSYSLVKRSTKCAPALRRLPIAQMSQGIAIGQQQGFAQARRGHRQRCCLLGHLLELIMNTRGLQVADATQDQQQQQQQQQRKSGLDALDD